MLARLATLLIWLSAGSALAQNVLRDDFEGPETSLRDPVGDGSFQIEPHHRVQSGPHSGRWCEHLAVRGNNGTYVYVSHPIAPARVIAELTPTIWVKSDRGGLQFLARVVLPRSLDPRTGKPLSTLVRVGETAYRQVGAWQQLRIENMPLLVERQVRVLRTRFGREVDAREAYIDRLLLNVYGGPGVTNVWVDDLEVTGIVGAIDLAGDPAAGGGSENGPMLAIPQGPRARGVVGALPRVDFKNPLLFIDGKPFFLRSIEYQGEPLARLQSLGFNAVRLKQPPTDELLREARATGLWLIAPPPPPRAFEAPRVRPIGDEFDPVLAWDLGTGLSASQLESTKNWAKLVAAADPRKRPIVCGADTDLRAYTRPPVKIFVARRDPIGTNLPLDQYVTWMRERTQLVVPGTPVWAAIQTEPSPRLANQIALLTSGRAMPGPLNEAQIRAVVRGALAAGARGLCFESDSRLDARDPVTTLRAQVLELINLELDLIERWPAAGNVAAAATTSDAGLIGGVLETDRSRLLLPVFAAAGNQFVMGNVATKKLSLVASGVPEECAAWELSPTRFRRLSVKRITGGTQVVMDETDRDAMVVFTQDPRVVQFLQARVAKSAQRATQLVQEVARAELGEVEALEGRLATIGRTIAPTSKVREEIKTALGEADSLVKSAAPGAVPSAYAKARQALSKMRDIQRVHWDKAITPNMPPLSDPLGACIATIDEHYRFEHEMASAAQGPNRVPEGAFEDLGAVWNAGWRYFQYREERVPSHIATSVDLLEQAAHSGRSGLRLRAALVDPKAKPGVVETPPLWITSAKVPVQRGELVLVEGWVRTPSPILGSVDGLLVVDTLSGEPLAHRVVNTDNKWVQFRLYRAAPFTGVMTVTFVLTGLGTVDLDDVSIHTIDRQTTNAPQQAQNAPPSVPGS